MTFNLELTGEQVQMIRSALMSKSNKVYQNGDDALSIKLDAVEECITEQCYAQREAA